MITKSSIEQILQIDLLALIGKEVKLTPSGANHKGCCPFHHEKSASFMVNPAKGLYKCFGCGESGNNPIRFAMDYFKMDFVRAVEHLAAAYNIELQYEKNFNREAYEQQKTMLQKQREALAFAQPHYAQQLLAELANTQHPVTQYLTQRGITEAEVNQWQLGWAGTGWNELTPTIINQHNNYDGGILTGLIKRGQTNNYDGLRSRITIPLYNEQQELVGIAGRYLMVDGADAGKEFAKYINPPGTTNNHEPAIYQKSTFLFGIDKAMRHIIANKHAYLVEGYFAVIAMHKHGHANTVSSSGTALTIDQVNRLSKFTNRVTIFGDNDTPKSTADGRYQASGIMAVRKNLRLLLEQGLKVVVMFSEVVGQDPDDYLQQYPVSNTPTTLPQANDAVLWEAQQIMADAGTDTFEIGRAKNLILELLALIPDEVVRQEYFEDLKKKYKLSAEHKKRLHSHTEAVEEKREAIKERSTWSFPKGVDESDVYKNGFYQLLEPLNPNTGYWFATDGGSYSQATNFVVTPLYHIYSDTNNRRMIVVNNGFYEKTLEVDSTRLISVDSFIGSVYKEGNFLPQASFTKIHLMKILNSLGDKFPLTFEMDKLGWQSEGFFAFNNKVYIPGTGGNTGSLMNYNEYGVVKVNDQYYLSPSIGVQNTQSRDEESIYENDKYLTFKEATITFERWAELMVKVYAQNGWVTIPFVLATIFRDIIMKFCKIPHLYAYGPIQSGKSEFGESVSNFFFSGKDASGELYKPMNLNAGTIYAFYNRYERFKNCPNALNEFDENSVEDEIFRAIKQSFDGEGREKGIKEKGRAKTMKINSTTVLMGQYLGTKDDNSVISRSIPLAFSRNRTEEQYEYYPELKRLEKEGLSGILCQLLDMRWKVVAEFENIYSRNKKSILETCKQQGLVPMVRLLNNISCMVSMVDIATACGFKLPYTLPEFTAFGVKLLTDLCGLVQRTSGISEFWQMVEYLVDRGLIIDRQDYDVVTVTEIDVERQGKEVVKKTFTIPTKVLLVRMNTVHKLYQKEYTTMHRKPAIDQETMMLYMREQSYYLGKKLAHRFYQDGRSGSFPTTCQAFIYGELNVSLERMDQPDDERPEVEVIGMVNVAATQTTVEGKFKFMILTETETGNQQFPKVEKVFYQCYTNEPDALLKYTTPTRVRVKGLLTVTLGRDKKEWKQIDVTEGEQVITPITPGTETLSEAIPF